MTGTGQVLTFDPQFVIDGDGTVVESSAQWSNGSPSTQYWINLMSLNAATSTFYQHANIFEIPQVDELLSNIITNPAAPLPQYISVSRPNDDSVSRRYFILHSPLTLGFTDSAGNYTGASSTSAIFNVPGVEYEQFGEVQWLSVPANLAGQVIMRGTGSGSFALDVQEVNGNDIIATTTFAAVPSSTSTVATLNISPSQSPTTDGDLVVDENGDGSKVLTLHAEQNATVLPDITPPVTSLALNGTKGQNGCFVSNVTVNLTATDTESGVKSTFFSLDGAATSTGTSTVVSSEGIHSLTYYSIDNVGNKETPTSTVIKIDKTPPEAIISASTSTKDLVVTGTDNLSTTTVIKTTSTATTITDQAGNSTTLYFQKTFSGGFLTYAKLASIQYGTSTPIALPSSFVYIWNPLTNPPTLLSQTVTADSTFVVEALFDKSKNKTSVIVLKKNTPIQTTSVTGLVVIKLTTAKGTIGYSW